MSRTLSFIYGLLCYCVFLLTFLYAIAFVGNFLVPRTIDSGPKASLPQALLVDLILLGLFAVQHTIMARPGFKRVWTKMVPVHIERSTYVLVASLLLLLLYWQWRPMPTVIWDTGSGAATTLLWALYGLGWFLVLISTFMVDHFDLFGLRQIWMHLRAEEYHHPKFKTNALYRYLRHPIMLGFIIAFWATPHMTRGHLLFAIATTLYILVGVQFEERDLMRFLGNEYKNYRQRVPMFIPFLKHGGSGED
jgi:protein-S-isoprenylcysteine O-methyltransferase Ste14